MPRTWTEPRVRVEVLLDEADRRSGVHDATFWSLRERPKEIPAVWLYDERGSRLFEEITRLPEYYLSAAEREILVARADEIAERTEAAVLVELGAGSAEKTRLLLDALDRAGTLERFVPLDVSGQTLRASAEAVAATYPRLGVHAIVGDFERHLAALPTGESRLVAFLGSTIGNLYPRRRGRLLTSLAAALGPDDALLLGLDLVKDRERLEAAYNDRRGVTEAFVRNALAVVNSELGARFEQRRFAFEAHWDPDHEWMDIGFRALVPHLVPVRCLGVEVPFENAEQLRVEVSAKFRREQVEHELRLAGLRTEAWWTDRAGDFALALAQADPARSPEAR